MERFEGHDVGFESVPLMRPGEMCHWYWSGLVLPESRSDRSGEHNCFRSNQFIGDAVIRIFDSKVQVMIDGLLWERLDCPIRRVNECGFL